MNCFTFRCTCGNCSCAVLVNICECYYCKELEGCCEALTSDQVKEGLQDVEELNCITEHPGFRPICLEKWSLWLAGGKYRTRNKQGYKKTGSEERSDNPGFFICFYSTNPSQLYTALIYTELISIP